MSRFFAAAIVLAVVARGEPTLAQQPSLIPRDSLDRWMVRVSNAGRWGAADELGTLNLITPAVRRRAAAGVRAGTIVSLARELVPGPNPRSVAPVALKYLTFPADSLVTWGLDSLTVLAHGWA